MGVGVPKNQSITRNQEISMGCGIAGRTSRHGEYLKVTDTKFQRTGSHRDTPSL